MTTHFSGTVEWVDKFALFDTLLHQMAKKEIYTIDQARFNFDSFNAGEVVNRFMKHSADALFIFTCRFGENFKWG